MRNTDIRFSSATDSPSNNIRYPIQFIPFHSNQNPSIYYQTPMALHLSPNQINNGSHLNNNNNSNNNNSVLYPPIYQIGHQQLMLSGNPHLVISVPCAAPNVSINSNNTMTNQSSLESQMSSVTSPISLLSNPNQLSINYSLSKWNEIASFYDDGNDDGGNSRPSAGQLRNGKCFTQRSAGNDIYMVFNSKADYINNFVNYYFSNKNFSTDEKLFNLMDDNGSVALSDLIKFPRLAQIGTTIEDIIEALKFSHFVVIVNLKNEIKGVRRSDGWFPTKLIDESQISVNSQWSTSSNGDNSASFNKSSSEIYRINNKLLSNQNIVDLTNVVPATAPSHHGEIKSQIDAAAVAAAAVPNNSSLIYFNPSNNAAIHQSMYAASAFVHGIHQNPNFPQSSGTLAVGGGGAPPMLAPGHTQKLILNTQSHYSNPPTIFQPNPSILRPVWQSQTIVDVSRQQQQQQQQHNHHLHHSSLYSSNNNNNNVRHVIGAIGNNQTNQKQCQY